MSDIKATAAICIQRILSVFPINQKKIFSLNYYGKGYGDNGKYVCNEVIKKCPDSTIIWPIKGECQLGDGPDNVKAVRYYSLSFFYHLATSKVWISNVRMPSYFRKRRTQYYIQMWHASISLKQVEADAADTLLPSYIEGAKNDSKMADLFLSNGKYISDLIRKAFWYDGEILECGFPRLDALFHDESKREFLKKKAGLEYERILLYAPTFRVDMSLDSYSMDYARVKEALEAKTGKSWHICVRLHPSVTGAGIKIDQISGVTDLSFYPDLYELLQITDLLITDYSGTMFEVASVKTPVILFATDIEEYNRDRKFYFEIDKLPFPLARSNDELIEAIEHWNENDYQEKVSCFMGQFGIVDDGSASEKVADVIIQHMK